MSNTMQKLNTQYTIILGAEGLIGRAMAREIARKGCNLILVSTTSIDLQRFAMRLQLKKEVQVNAVKLDLSDREAIQAFTEEVRNRFEVRALINNVTCDWSVAHHMYISELATEDFLTRFRGVALVTWNLLPQMSKLPSAYIQHIIPFPFRKNQFSPVMQQSVSKMYAFSRELNEELKQTGVAVSMVHPAPLKNMRAQMDYTDGIFEEEIHTITPRTIAIKAVNGMLRGDRLIVPGFWNRVQFFLNWQATSWFRGTDKSLGSSLQPSL
jgi:short-subunit dehydrogenase